MRILHHVFFIAKVERDVYKSPGAANEVFAPGNSKKSRKGLSGKPFEKRKTITMQILD